MPVTTPTLWGEEVTISADPNAFGFTATGLANNNFAIVWSDTLGDIHGRRFDPLGNFNSTDFLFNLSQTTTQDLRLPELIQLENGSVQTVYSYAAGAANEDIYVNFVNFDATGGSGDGYTVVANATDQFKLDQAAVEYNNASAMAVVYTQLRGTTGFRDLYLAYTQPNGIVIGSPVVVPVETGETVSSAQVVGLNDGTVLVTYTAQKFDNTTHTTSNYTRYRVYNDYGDLTGARNVSSTPGDDVFPVACALDRSSDGFVIATQDPLAIRILYHGFGHEITKAVPGSQGSGGGAFAKAISPKITALHDQGFIVAWTDTTDVESDGSPALKIVLQRFDRDANAVGGNLIIDHPGDQSLNSIATLADGRVIVTFDNETGDSTNHFTHDYQIIDPRDPTIYGTALSDNIVGREDASTIYGYEGVDALTGRAANDTIDGGAGADVMAGGAGADTYYVDNVGDRVIEDNVAGIDTVLSSVSFKLGSQYIENLTLTGSANIDATGNSLANVLTGNSGANVLNGSTGADTMSGGAGADTYYVDNTGDRIIEGNVAGIDTALSTVSISLGSQYIENVTLTGTAAINAMGNSLANVLVGNSGANVLNGSTGLDTLTGGAGADKFWFSTAASAANVDHITDFNVVDDTIQISRSVFSAITGTGTLTSAQFVANSTGTATNTNQHIIYNTSTGQLFYDTNGSSSGGSTLFAVIDNHATAGTLTNADFLIV